MASKGRGNVRTDLQTSSDGEGEAGCGLGDCTATLSLDGVTDDDNSGVGSSILVVCRPVHGFSCVLWLSRNKLEVTGLFRRQLGFTNL